MRLARLHSTIAVCVLGGCLAHASDYQDAYAIVGAKIEVGDGRTIDKGTVVVEDGRIVAVGKDVVAPKYCKVIKGDGLTVYPGFIDTYYTGGITLPPAIAEVDTPLDNVNDAPPSMRLANRKIVKAQLDAADYLSLTPAILSAERSAGFTTALAVSNGDLVSSASVVIDFNGLPTRESVIARNFSLGFGFRAQDRSGYPGSLMGTIAFIRQTLMDANDFPQLRGSVDDAALARLSEFLRSRNLLTFEADNQNEIRRAKSLLRPYGANLAIVGGLEAYKLGPELSDVRWIAGVGFGNEAGQGRGRRPTGDEALPEAVQADRLSETKERLANLAGLEKAGVEFTLTGRGTRDRAEFFSQLRRAVAAGCSKKAVLKALTINAAKLLGVDKKLGTVESGKVANLAVFSDDFLSAEAKVNYVFIRGRMFKPGSDRPAVTPPRRPRGYIDDDGDDIGIGTQKSVGGGR